MPGIAWAFLKGFNRSRETEKLPGRVKTCVRSLLWRSDLSLLLLNESRAESLAFFLLLGAKKSHRGVAGAAKPITSKQASQGSSKTGNSGAYLLRQGPEHSALSLLRMGCLSNRGLPKEWGDVQFVPTAVSPDQAQRELKASRHQA